MFDIHAAFLAHTHRWPPSDPNRDPRVSNPAPDAELADVTTEEAAELLRGILDRIPATPTSPAAKPQDGRGEKLKDQGKGTGPELLYPNPDAEPKSPVGGGQPPLPPRPIGKWCPTAHGGSEGIFRGRIPTSAQAPVQKSP